MFFTMRWVGRSRNRPAKSTADGSVLRYPPSILIIGAVGGGMFLAVATAVFFSDEDKEIFFSPFFLAFSSLGWPLVVGYFVEFHELRSDGIRFRTTLLRTGFVAWAEIKEISYRHMR
jgi:hypothetical protein